MKNLVLNVAVALAVLFSVSNVNAQSLPEFLYNTYEENGKITSKHICKLNPVTNKHELHLMHEYAYTDNGLLQSNQTFHWNKETNSWDKSSIVTYEHDNLLSTVTVNYAVWNPKENAFDAPSQKAVYQYLDKDHLTYYTQYKKNNSDWEIKTHFSMNNYFVSQLIK